MSSPATLRSSAQNDQAIAELTTLLGKRATAALVQREQHSHGESYHAPALPDIVCFPHTTDEVSAIVKISQRTISSPSSPSAPAPPRRPRQRPPRRHHPRPPRDEQDSPRQRRGHGRDRPGRHHPPATRKALNNTGLTFFIDPGADATIGGMTATRASGTTAVRYGTMRENVLGLTVVLADGRIIHTGSRARKSSAGYDLTHLFVGSEGTLGVITEIMLRLHALPEAVSAAVCSFASVEGAVETAIEAIQLGLKVARIEFLDDKQIEAINRFSRISLAGAPHALLRIPRHERSRCLRAIQPCSKQSLRRAWRREGFQWKKSPEERDILWKARHDAYYAAHALRARIANLDHRCLRPHLAPRRVHHRDQERLLADVSSPPPSSATSATAISTSSASSIPTAPQNSQRLTASSEPRRARARDGRHLHRRTRRRPRQDEISRAGARRVLSTSCASSKPPSTPTTA